MKKIFALKSVSDIKKKLKVRKAINIKSSELDHFKTRPRLLTEVSINSERSKSQKKNYKRTDHIKPNVAYANLPKAMKSKLLQSAESFFFNAVRPRSVTIKSMTKTVAFNNDYVMSCLEK